MPTFVLVTLSAKDGSRKIKSKRRKGGTQPWAKKQQNLVPGARHGPNACPPALIGWLRHESTPKKLWVTRLSLSSA
jgi:hypothetical protein